MGEGDGTEESDTRRVLGCHAEKGGGVSKYGTLPSLSSSELKASNEPPTSSLSKQSSRRGRSSRNCASVRSTAPRTPSSGAKKACSNLAHTCSRLGLGPGSGLELG